MHDASPARLGLGAERRESLGKRLALGPGKPRFELGALRAQGKTACAPVLFVGHDEHEPGFLQLAQRRMQGLLADPESRNQLADPQARLARHEIQDAVMQPRQPPFGQNLVRPGREGAKREEEQLDRLME